MPDKIDRYQIKAKISESHLSITYEAHDPGTGRNVAIKLLKDNDIPNAEEEFIKETRIVGRLNHHNIASVYDVGEHDGRSFIAMELLQGDFLDALMDNGKRFSWSLVAQVAMQIASALEYAHNQGVVHGDIRPGNILWNRADNKIVLTDFGNAKQLNLVDTITLKAEQVTKSTPYLSPELVNGRGADSRSDLFSLGSVLYQMLTGFKPFDSEDFKELTTQITKRAHKAISVSVTQVPEEFIKIIDKLLYKDPAQRYQNATDLIRDLELLPKHVDVPSPYRGKHHFKIAAGLLILACAGVLFMVFRDHAPPPEKVAKVTEPEPEPQPEIIAKPIPTKIQMNTLQADINKKLEKFECASLHANFTADNEVRIQGHVSLEEDMITLMDLMDGYPGLSNVTYEVNAIKWPFCEAIAIFSVDTHANISAERGLKVISSVLNARQVNAANNLNFNVTAPNYDSYVYVDYYHANGTVTHLYPKADNFLTKTRASSQLQVVHRDGEKSGALLGESLVVVLASYNPLLTKSRPTVEPAQQYLAALHREVVVNKVELSAAYLMLENVPVSKI